MQKEVVFCRLCSKSIELQNNLLLSVYDISTTDAERKRTNNSYTYVSHSKRSTYYIGISLMAYESSAIAEVHCQAIQ